MSFKKINLFIKDFIEEIVSGPGTKNLFKMFKSPIGFIGTLFIITSLVLGFFPVNFLRQSVTGILPDWMMIFIPDLTLLWWLFFYISVAESWNVIGGYAGEVDFGHVLFVAFGVYSVGIIFEKNILIGFLFDFTFNFLGIEPNILLWLVLVTLLAGLISALVAVIIGIPTLKLKGAYFAVTLLAFNEVLLILFNYPNDLTHGGAGIDIGGILGQVPELRTYVYFGIILVSIFSFLITHYISYTRLGLNLRAIRDNAEGAAASGINVFRTKVIAFSISGFMAGMSGAVLVLRVFSYTPAEAFKPTLTVEMIIITLLGGIGTVFGPIVGALIIVPLKFRLPDLVTLIFGTSKIVIFDHTLNFEVFYLIIYGVTFILAVLYLQRGIIGILQDKGLLKRESLVEVEDNE